MKWYLFVLIALVGCSSPDPTKLMGSPSRAAARGSSDKGGSQRESTVDDAVVDSANEPDGAATDGDAVDAAAGSDGDQSPDGGATTDGASEAGEGGGGGGGAFAGAGPYVQTAGVSARRGGHNFVGNTPTTNPAGQACFACHGNGQTQFTIAGTAYQDVAGTQPAANVEVRVVDANGTAYRAYTDVDGNYYLAGAALVAPARSGARTTITRTMTGTISTGNCNGCHTGTTTARIHVP